MKQLSLFGDNHTAKTLLISLQNQYFQMIVKGEKRFEYRRKFRRDPVNAFVYINSPVKAIAGFLILDSPVIGPPSQIASVAENERAGNYNAVFQYLSDLEEAYAIPIKEVRTFSPINLSEIKMSFPNFFPPQSYMILNNKPDFHDYLLLKSGITS